MKKKLFTLIMMLISFSIQIFAQMRDYNAMVVDAVLARYYNTKNPGKYAVLDETMGDEVVAVAFRKDDTALRDKIDKVLDEMKKDGTCKKISEKWMGADITKY